MRHGHLRPRGTWQVSYRRALMVCSEAVYTRDLPCELPPLIGHLTQVNLFYDQKISKGF